MSERKSDAPNDDVASIVTDFLRDPGNMDSLSDCIRRIMTLPLDMDRRCRMLGELRAIGDEKTVAALDRYFLAELEGIGKNHELLRTKFSELKNVVDGLLLPPYFMARYLGARSTQLGEFACVSQGGAQCLVGFAENFDPSALEPGDVVLLTHERNCIVDKADSAIAATGETAAFVSRINDSTIVLADRDAEVVVQMAESLQREPLKVGDVVLWDRGARLALSRLEGRREHDPFEELDGAEPAALGGHDEAQRSVIRLFTASIGKPDKAARYGLGGNNHRRLLLKGPPGTGKTTLMRIVASEIAAITGKRCRIVTLSAAKVYSSYYGETEKNIARCFSAVEDYDGPSVIFVDEIDAIGRVRGHLTSRHEDRALGTILAGLEGMKRSNAAVIAATNRPDALDPALRGRFGWELEMPRPNKSAAHSIFAIHLPQWLPYKPNGSEAPATRELLVTDAVARLYEPNADNLVASLQFRDGKRRDVAARELVSGRLIEQICIGARMKAFERDVEFGETGVCVEDMRNATAEAIERLRHTLTPANAKSYLFDLPQDLDVVAVKPVEHRVDAARYRH